MSFGRDSGRGVLSGEDLEGLAQAAWWSGRLEDAIAAGERAYAAYTTEEDRVGAARAALTLAKDNYTKHAAAVGAGWLARAERLLAESTESVVHGYLARPRAVLAFEVRAISTPRWAMRTRRLRSRRGLATETSLRWRCMTGAVSCSMPVVWLRVWL